MMSTAGVAAPEMSSPLKCSFLHGGQSIGALNACWGGHATGFENAFFSMDPVAPVAHSTLDPPSAHHHSASVGPIPDPSPAHEQHHSRAWPQTGSSPPLSPRSERAASALEDCLVSSLGRLSVDTGCCYAPAEVPPPPPPLGKSGPLLTPPVALSTERSARPLPPLPVAQDFLHHDEEEDREVEFLTSSDTDFLLEDCRAPVPRGPSAQDNRRSFRDCGQINYAYLEAPAGPGAEEPCPVAAPGGGGVAGTCPPPPAQQHLHRRLRRSHSGPAGSFNKPVVRVSSHFHRASPSSDDDKPEVPPRAPIPPRVLKPDYRRWSAEVASSAYSDEDKPPKVPPREPLSRSNSRTPSPKSLPLYLNGVMPPTQSFAPDPNYVSSKALQRQHSEGSAHRVPCILPIIENGRKASSTHYYLLPERPPYLDKYEKFFQEAEETTLSAEGQLWGSEVATPRLGLRGKAGVVSPVKRKHLPCMVSP